MNKNNSGKSSRSNERKTGGDFKKSVTSKSMSDKRAFKKDDSFGTTKKTSFKRSSEKSAGESYPKKKNRTSRSEGTNYGKPGFKRGANNVEGAFGNKKKTDSRPASKRIKSSEDRSTGKRTFDSKPTFKKGRSNGESNEKRNVNTKPAFKRGRRIDGDTSEKSAYGAKPAFKRGRRNDDSGEKSKYSAKRAIKRGKESEIFVDKRKSYVEKPAVKRNSGPYAKKAADIGDKNREFRDKPVGRYVLKLNESENDVKKPLVLKTAFRKDADKTKSYKENPKKAYGSASTFKERSAIKSITEKEEKPERKKSFGKKEDNLKGTYFTKKSEMKGYKPRKENETEDTYISKTKSQSKERITENELYSGAEIRLNRFISNAGVSSRREADELIGAGLVTINGDVVTELGTKVKAGDIVKFNGQKLTVEAKVYILLNKPKDAITTSDDPDGRNTVMDLFDGKMKERIFPVGRLDRNTTGVLLLTNDGELANRLMHPKHEINKVYKATLNKGLKSSDLWTLANGIMLDDGLIKPDAIAQPDSKDKNIVGIEIHSGRNRIIHRMFEHLGYSVDKLDRVLYAGLEKGNLKRGEWREITEKELKALKRIVHLR